MTEKQTHKNSRWKKSALLFLGGLVCLVIVGRFLLTTSIAHEFVKNKIESIGNESLNGILSIEKLEGDLWNELLLTGVRVTQVDTLLEADSLYSKYSAWSFLTGTNRINQVKATGFHTIIKEREDSTYNLEQLVLPDETEASEPFQFVVDQIIVRNSGATIYSPSVLPDTVLGVQDINLDASFSKKDDFNISLSSLSFLVDEGRLPEPIKIRASGGYEQQQITLQEIVFETGRSVLKAQAFANTSNSSISSQLGAIPVSLEDIQPYIDRDLPEDDLEMSVSATGSLEDLKIKVNLNSQYAPNFEIVAGVNLSGTPTLTQFGLLGDGLDIAHFTNDSIDANVGDFRVTLDGVLSQNVAKADVIWGYTLNNIRYGNYNINRIIGSGTIQNDEIIAHLGVNPQMKENLNATYKLSQLSAKLPSWQFSFNLADFDISFWTNLKDIPTKLDLRGSIEGSGFSLSETPWEYSIGSVQYQYLDPLNEKKAQVAGQFFNEYGLRGTINEKEVTAEGHIIIEESRVDIDFQAQNFLEETPSYEYSISTRGFDLSEVNQLKDFPTSLNLEITGEGKGKDIENSIMSASAKIDSSIANGSRVQEFSTNLSLENGILTISKGVLKSDIFGGSFSGRRNIADFSDPDNKLSVNFSIQDIQPLAPLINLEVLSASGIIIGDITQDTSGILACDLLVDLEDVQIDTLFTSPRMFGEARASLETLKTFDINFAIESPVISKITLQDIYLESDGIVNEDTLHTNFSLEVIGSDRGKLLQEGIVIVDVSENQLDLKLNKFDFTTAGSVLGLEKEFNLRLKDKGVGTDTLKLKSTSGAFLNFVMPYADSLEQHAWINGESFDFGVIQEVIFGERFLDGVLSGEIVYNNSSESLIGAGELILDRVDYQGIKADQLSLNFDVIEQRLFADGIVNWDGEDKVVGNLDVPFALFDEEALDESFFNEPVRGELTIVPSNLNRFEELLGTFGITQTTGIVNFNGIMNGTAGEPNFEGAFKIDSPVLSGITLDSVLASFNYDNSQSGLFIESEMLKSGQKAAEVQVTYPISYDFRGMALNLPGKDDFIKVDLKTDNFNIAVLNDFVDRNYINQLTGVLNADVSFEGTKDNIKPKGFITLNNANVSIPVAGITLEYLTSDFAFSETGLEVKNISAKSGGGSFKANGMMELEGVFPKTLNINASANQFKLANTDDYNMVIDLQGKLSGSALTPKATGKLSIRNGFVFLNDFGAETIENIELDGEEITSFSPFDSLEIDMEIEINRNFFVRNRSYLDMEIEVAGNVDAQKETGGELELFGSFNGLEGYVRPLGKRFDVEEAVFTFSGPPENPDLNIKSKHIPPTRQKGESVILYYLIEGTAEDPVFTFDSNPQMDQSDIVCYTLFTKPCTSLDSWQSVFAGGGNTTATDLLADVLLDEVEALATRELGVDVVQISNTGSGSQSGTAIKTGWYINEKTFFAIINEITNSTPKTLFVLEYILSKNVDLILTQGNDSRQGIDLRFQYDY